MVLAISHQVNGGDSGGLWGIVKMWPYPVPLTNSSILYPPIFTIGHISSLCCSMGKEWFGFLSMGGLFCVVSVLCI